MKRSLLLFLIVYGTLQAQSAQTPVAPVSSFKALAAFQPHTPRKLSEQLQTDSFGLSTRGSLIKKENFSQKEKPAITLESVTAGLRLYGVFPDNEAIVNSVLWKVNNKLIIRYQNHDYVLILKEATENQIIIGWSEDESVREISLGIPQRQEFIEQPQQQEIDHSESMLVLDTQNPPSRLKTTEKK